MSHLLVSKKISSYQRFFVFYSILFLFCAVDSSFAENQKNIISLVLSRDMKPYHDASEGFKEGAVAYLQDYRIDEYNLRGDIDAAQNIADELKNKRSNLIVTVGTEAFTALKDKVEIPMVMLMVYDAEKEIMETGKKDQKIYAVSLEIPLIEEIKLIHQIIPKLKKIAVIQKFSNRQVTENDCRYIQQHFQIEIITFAIDELKDLNKVLEDAKKQTDALLMELDRDIYNRATAKELLLFSARKKYPIIAYSENYVKSGALLSISADFKDNGYAGAKIAAAHYQGHVPEHYLRTQKKVVAWNSKAAATFNLNLNQRAQSLINENY